MYWPRNAVMDSVRNLWKRSNGRTAWIGIRSLRRQGILLPWRRCSFLALSKRAKILIRGECVADFATRDKDRLLKVKELDMGPGAAMPDEQCFRGQI
jgi:hypothetical protein